MNTMKIIALTSLAAVFWFVTACQPLPLAGVQSTTVESSLTPAPSSISAPAVTTVPPDTRALTGTSAPTNTPAPAAGEEDCMGACHIPDPNDYIASGAMPQPANHIAHMTCLECHSTLAKPALPATHFGRLDASCTVCHKPGASAK